MRTLSTVLPEQLEAAVLEALADHWAEDVERLLERLEAVWPGVEAEIAEKVTCDRWALTLEGQAVLTAASRRSTAARVAAPSTGDCR